MAIVGGFDVHRSQITFDYLDTATGEVSGGRIAPATRESLRRWLTRFSGEGDVAFALEGCTGWRFVVEELGFAASKRTWRNRLTPPPCGAAHGGPSQTV